MIFVTGATGYLGRPLVERLVKRGHRVRALVRRGSERKLPRGAEAIAGDPLSLGDVEAAMPAGACVVQLLGTPKPSPWKGKEFQAVDRKSALATIEAAHRRGATHFVYVSVAHPAPIMRDYIAVREECEQALRRTGVPATILRPWYVLGPGHWWPYAILPAYWMMGAIPPTRETAKRLGLVTHGQMIESLVWAIENPSPEWRVLDVAAIRAGKYEGEPVARSPMVA
ncbi:MAG: NAD(P)H-binding protein [Bryobacteraceae bacterium]